MAVTFRRFVKGILLKGESSDPTDNLEGSLFHNNSDNRLKAYIEAAVRNLVTEDQTQTLTNKSIDADSGQNTLTNVRDVSVAADADITRTKLAPGVADHVLINDGSGEVSSEAQLAPSRGGLGADLSAAEGMIQFDAGVISQKQIKIDDTGSSAVTTLDLNATVGRTITLPDADDTLVGLATTDTLTNKTIGDDLAIQGTTGSTSTATGALTVAGGAGITENLYVGGDLIVEGNTTTINTATLDVEDANITVNKGGDDTSAEGSGLTVERAGTDGSLAYEDALTSKFKIGALGAEVEVADISSSQVITNKDIDGGTASDTSRITIPSADRTTLEALTRKEATLVYDTDSDTILVDDGTSLNEIVSDSGDAFLEPEEGYQAVQLDNFEVVPSDADSKVDDTLTNATYDGQRDLYQLSCDKTPTFTTTGTTLSISSAPSFTIAAGDVVYDGTSGEVRRIASITDQQNATLDAAFTVDLAANSGMISQAVYTKDLVNLGDAAQQTRARDFFSDDIDQIFVEYQDSLASQDEVADFVDAARIAMVASNEGLVTDTGVPTSDTFGTVYERPAAPTKIQNFTLSANTNEKRLHLVFFCSPTNASVTTTANLIQQKTSFYAETVGTSVDTDVIQSAYGLADNSSSAINCAISVVSSKTQVALDFFYPAGLFSGTTSGALQVYVDGQKIPRGPLGVPAGQLYYEEGSSSGASKIITFSDDLSSQPLDIQIELIDTRTNGLEASDIVSQELLAAGFNDFVDDSIMLSPVNGAPGASQYRSEITNRAPIRDDSQALSSTMSIERVHVNGPVLLRDEFGPNGEQVWEADNKDSRIRFYGSWRNFALSSGTGFQADGEAFIEVVFYGTSLNLIGRPVVAGRSIFPTVDGGAEGSDVFPSNPSSILNNRNYSANVPIPIVSGLSLGWHTVKLRLVDSSGTTVVFGFEFINESTQIVTNPGTGYAGGEKEILTAQALTDFDAGVSGTRGARVVKYLLDGQVQQAVQEVDASQLNLASADHSNEEVYRRINFREFGANRADDFSTLSTVTSDRAFTLDDGTTTLVGSDVATSSSLGVDEAVFCINGGFLTLTFVGTGLDVDAANVSGTQVHEVFVDGTSVGTILPTTTFQPQRITIVSGLPYGTHTVKLERTGAAGSFGFTDFYIYQPKKPEIPANAVELADYNVMADFVANNIQALNRVSTGVLRKDSSREITYLGSNWTIPSINPDLRIGGISVETTGANAVFSYTFFGTGFDLRYITNTTHSTDNTVTVDGLTMTDANYPSVTKSIYGGSFNSTTGVFSQVDSLLAGAGLVISGLPLGIHTVEIDTGVANGLFLVDAIDIITPIHFPDTSTGSRSLSDSRNFSPIQEEKEAVDLSKAKAWLYFDGIDNEILSSHNISAVIDGGTGIYYVYFERPMKTGNYAVVASQSNTGGTVSVVNFSSSGGVSEPHVFRLRVRSSSNNDADGWVYAAVFGELEGEGE